MVDMLFVMLFSASACIIGFITFFVSTFLLVMALTLSLFKTIFFIVGMAWNWLRSPIGG